MIGTAPALDEYRIRPASALFQLRHLPIDTGRGQASAGDQMMSEHPLILGLTGEECGACDGTGKEQAVLRLRRPSQPLQLDPCRVCDGTGMVPKRRDAAS